MYRYVLFRDLGLVCFQLTDHPKVIEEQTEEKWKKQTNIF